MTDIRVSGNASTPDLDSIVLAILLSLKQTELTRLSTCQARDTDLTMITPMKIKDTSLPPHQGYTYMSVAASSKIALPNMRAFEFYQLHSLKLPEQAGLHQISTPVDF